MRETFFEKAWEFDAHDDSSTPSSCSGKVQRTEKMRRNLQLDKAMSSWLKNFLKQIVGGGGLFFFSYT